jgi:hypothetical protein
LLAGGISASLLGFSQAQPTNTAPSADDLQTLVQALEETTPIPASQLPAQAPGFFSVQNPSWPPLPIDVLGLNAWPLGNGFFAVDDRGVDYAALQAEAAAAALLSGASGSPFSTTASSLLNSGAAYGNPVYLTNLAVSASGSGAMGVSFSVSGGTNNVPYDILMSTNVAQPLSGWTWLGVGYTSNSYTFSNQPPNQAFYILAKPQNTTVVGWGDDSVGQCAVPMGVTNALMVAGGGGQSLALLSDGTVVAWGQNYYGEGSVPTGLGGVAMVAAGWFHDVALLTNGTVVAWGMSDSPWFGGMPLTNVPPNLTNATVISAQALHTLALTSNGTVVAWGYGEFGETNVPAGLSNVVAIAAGFQFNLAVTTDGTVTAWGATNSGQCNVPAGLSNVVNVAAGTYHSLALLNNGTVVAWGDDLLGETDVPAGLTNVVALLPVATLMTAVLTASRLKATARSWPGVRVSL